MRKINKERYFVTDKGLVIKGEKSITIIEPNEAGETTISIKPKLKRTFNTKKIPIIRGAIEFILLTIDIFLTAFSFFKKEKTPSLNATKTKKHFTITITILATITGTIVTIVFVCVAPAILMLFISGYLNNELLSSISETAIRGIFLYSITIISLNQKNAWMHQAKMFHEAVHRIKKEKNIAQGETQPCSVLFLFDTIIYSAFSLAIIQVIFFSPPLILKGLLVLIISGIVYEASFLFNDEEHKGTLGPIKRAIIKSTREEPTPEILEAVQKALIKTKEEERKYE